jgi:TetR/AcrR family transcriptional repressor of bet genes
MARPSNTEARRAQITRALVKVMAKRGYDGASVADIAKTARLTPGLVHYHFKNKREVLLAALDDLVLRHDAQLEVRLTRAGGDPILDVASFIDFHLGFGADADPEVLACWILLSGEALREPKVRVAFEKALGAAVARLSEVIRRGVEQRVFACEAADAAASALVAAIQGYFVLAATARKIIPKGSAAVSTKRMAEGLLRPSRPFTSKEARSRVTLRALPKGNVVHV